MLKYRLTFGPLFILLALGLAWLDERIDALAAPAWVDSISRDDPSDGTWPPGLLVFPVLAVMCVMAARELTRFLKSKGVPATKRLNGTLAVCGLALAAFVPESWAGTSGAGLINASVGIVLVVSLIIYSRRQQVEGMLAAAGGALLSFCYLGLLMAFWVLIRRDHSVWVMLWLVLVVKSCDIGAFFTGRAIGKHKLIPWLSPGKTWEGFWGGVVTSALVALGGGVLVGAVGPTGSAFPMWAQALLVGAALGAVGQLGDLLASLLKRDAGVKDAGRSLPGFGGMLDLIDSLVLAGPVAFWWLRVGAGSS